MKEEEAKILSLELLDNAEVAYLATVDKNCTPYIRAVCNFRNKLPHPEYVAFFDKIRDKFLLYFITNTSSEKMTHIKANPNVSVYYCIPIKFHGLMLSGKMEIVTDPEVRKELWSDNYKIYYPKGVDDPEYCVLRFAPTFARGWFQRGAFEFEINGQK